MSVQGLLWSVWSWWSSLSWRVCWWSWPGSGGGTAARECGAFTPNGRRVGLVARSAGAVALHVPVYCDILCTGLKLPASHRQPATRQSISIMRALLALASKIGMRMEVVRVEIYRSCTGAFYLPGVPSHRILPSTSPCDHAVESLLPFASEMMLFGQR